jgi:DNA polymerase II large subunit
MLQISPGMQEYLDRLNRDLAGAISVARAARAVGLDPRTKVEIPIANDLADRVEALLGIKGVAARIRELEQTMSVRKRR